MEGKYAHHCTSDAMPSMHFIKFMKLERAIVWCSFSAVSLLTACVCVGLLGVMPWPRLGLGSSGLLGFGRAVSLPSRGGGVWYNTRTNSFETRVRCATETTVRFGTKRPGFDVTTQERDATP